MNEPHKFIISLSAHPSIDTNITTSEYIPSTCIEDISISFHFSTCRRTRNASRATFRGIQNDAASADTIEKYLDSCYYSPLPSIVNSPASSQESVSSNTHNTSSRTTPTTRFAYATHEVKLETLLQLVDVSLRRMMSDCKPVRSGGIVLSSDAGCPKLATIAPAVFSPGYAKVQAFIEFHDAADGLPGGFAAYSTTAHNSWYCIPDVPPHTFWPPEAQAQATTRTVTQQKFGLWLEREIRPK